MAQSPTIDPVSAQLAYYAATAARYDEMHVGENDEHYFALAIMMSFFEFLDIRSILDVGAGTGRALIDIKQKYPSIRFVGVEPSSELRSQGQLKGLSPSELVDGDAQQLAYKDGEFDMVCEFGALHHIPSPRRAVSEMLRVAKKAIFISDTNNFGQGSLAARSIKQTINILGLWPVANFLKTGGKGYSVTEGDGVSYSYSVFDQYQIIKHACKSVHAMNTLDAGPNLYRSAAHIALLGIK